MPIPSGYTSGQVVQAVPTALATAIFNETQSSGTNGGTATSGSWFKRVLNTTVVNNIVGCSIASSVITLPAGTYCVTALAPNYKTDKSQFRLQNTTDATTIIYGTSNIAPAGANTGMTGTVQAYFTLAAQKDIELQNRVESTFATFGLGIAASFGGEVYATIQIEKVA